MPQPDHRGKRFVQVICQTVTAKNRVCGAYLGAVEISRPNTARVHCRACKKLEEWDVDEDGVVRVRVVPPNVRLKYYEEATIIREK